MKASIEVKDRREADAIRAGLEDPVLRATVIITGVLIQLPSRRAAQRVLEWVNDKLEEEATSKQTPIRGNNDAS